MKAVLVFCEGRHDVIFVQRTLGAIAGCDWRKWNHQLVRDLPTPFGSNEIAREGLIARRAAHHHLADLNLREVAHGPLPSFEALLEHEPTSTLYILIRSHGQDRHQGVGKLLEQIKDLALESAFDVKAYAVAFLFDADDEGTQSTLRRLRESFAEQLPGIGGLANDSWVMSGTIPVGCFVFHREGEDIGTLEDHLIPMIEAEWPQRARAAGDFIDAHRDEKDPVAKKQAERLKAVITTAGQFHQPGKPMSVILGHKSLPRKHFEGSALCKKVAAFLTSVPWLP